MDEELFVVILKYDIFEIDSSGSGLTIQDYIRWLKTMSSEKLELFRQQAHQEYD